MQSATVTLSYTLKLYPSRNKAETLACFAALFRQSHADCTARLAQGEGRCPSTRGMGEFIGRAYRRAYIDWRRTTKAGHRPGALQAELIDAAELQMPKRACHFEYWVMVKGTGDGSFRIPARGHCALRRALALPGAALNVGPKSSTEIFRRNGKWYTRVFVSVPLAEVQQPTGWLGCDVGARAAVTRSDGYRGPDLRPMLKRQKERKAQHQKQGICRLSITHQRHILAREARKAVLVALRSGRGVAVENPKRLIRWKQHGARMFGHRVLLLAAIHGLAVAVVNPAGTSLTCSRCGFAERRQRHKEFFRCWRCGHTRNADLNAALNLCHRAYAVTGVSPGSFSLVPRGGSADE